MLIPIFKKCIFILKNIFIFQLLQGQSVLLKCETERSGSQETKWPHCISSRYSQKNAMAGAVKTSFQQQQR